MFVQPEGVKCVIIFAQQNEGGSWQTCWQARCLTVPFYCFSKALSVKVTPGKVTSDNKQRLEQEEKAEEKRLAIMMMKKKDKYLYDKIMFGKKRTVREVRRQRSACTCTRLLDWTLNRERRVL